MIKLDLKNFKHKSSDDKTTTLEHKKDKHTITIYHNVLGKDAQKQLQALGQSAKDAQTEGQKQEAQDSSQYGKVMTPKGGKPQVFADGGGVGQYLDDVADQFSGQKKIEKSNSPGKRPEQSRVEGKPGATNNYYGFADGGDVEQALQPDFSPEAIQTAVDTANPVSKGINLPEDAGVNSLPDPAPSQYKTQAEQYKAQQAEPQMPEGQILQPEPPKAQPAAQPEPQQVSAKSNDKGLAPQEQADPYQQNMMGALGKQMQAQQEQAAALKAQGDQEKLALDKNETARSAAADAFKASVAELHQQSQAYQNDVKNGYIDPNKYWTGYTTPNGQQVPGHSKVAAVIGMLVAGFGGANGVKMLDDEVDRSIAAQKANLNSSNNLLRANLDQYKNLSDAYTATRMQLNDDIMNRLQAASAVAKGPLAKAAADNAIGELQQKQNVFANNIATSQAFAKLSAAAPNNDPAVATTAAHHIVERLMITDPEKAKAFSNRIVDGVGISNRVEGVNEATRQQLLGQQKLNNAGQDLLSYSQKHNNILPTGAEYNTGVTKAMAFQQAVREGMLGTVFRESEKPLLEKFVTDNPAGAFKQFTTQPRLRAILDSNRINYETTKQAAGIPPSPQQSQPQIKIVNGVKYMRGSDGKAVPVK